MKSNNQNYNPSLNDAAEAIAADDRELARTCIESVINDTSDNAAAYLMHHVMVLNGLNVTMELVQHDAHQAVVDLAPVASHQFVGNIHAHGLSQHLVAHIIGVTVAGVVAVKEVHFLTGQASEDHAGRNV